MWTKNRKRLCKIMKKKAKERKTERKILHVEEEIRVETVERRQKNQQTQNKSTVEGQAQ